MRHRITENMINRAVRKSINEASFNFVTYNDDRELSQEAMKQLEIAHNAMSSLQMTIMMNPKSGLAKTISSGIKSINDDIINMRNYLTFGR